ncbi:uncharacterized protein LOC126100619 [Schistocerca cancellata]|uniref:uncharacterized protein LOC126100619 n=1 Tax=Schistocerca cancellata TaxID=274614 RepID=UPI0021181373|nr:uncharacterized protein LOC126100619 [Schistocerca cancellata]
MAAWTRDELCVLIDAFKEEQCLYNVKSKNYHNKHFRSEALNRVFQKVKSLRSHLQNPKECQIKFSNMRNMFSVENNKRKESMKTGSGTDDVDDCGTYKQSDPAPADSELEVDSATTNIEDVCSTSNSSISMFAPNDQASSQTIQESVDMSTPTSSTKKRKGNEDYGSAVILIAKALQEDDESDETDLFAKFLGAEIKKLNATKRKDV